MEEIICLCDFCSCFCSETESYLCEDCDPFIYNFNDEESEGIKDDEQRNEDFWTKRSKKSL